MFDLRRAGNWQHHRRAPQQPRERDLRRSGAVLLRDAREHAAAFSKFSGLQRKPRNEADALPRTVLEDALPLPVGDVVSILNGDDSEEAPRALNLIDCDLGQSDMPNFSFALKPLQRSKLLFLRYLWIDPMQLPQINALQSQPFQAALQLFAQALR